MENRRRGILSSEFHAYLFVDALLSPAEKGLTSWLSFLVSNCYVVVIFLGCWEKAWRLTLFKLHIFI